LKTSIYIQIVIRWASIHRLSICIIDLPTTVIYQTFISDLGSLSETSMKVEKKSELIGRGGFYRRPVDLSHRQGIERRH
jgi:hypothetical protein